MSSSQNVTKRIQGESERWKREGSMIAYLTVKQQSWVRICPSSDHGKLFQILGALLSDLAVFNCQPPKRRQRYKRIV